MPPPAPPESAGQPTVFAAAIATATGIPRFVANCLPEEKSREVHALRASGSHIAVQTADVAILQPELRRLLHFLEISRRAMSLVHQNLAVSAVIIVLALLVSGLGLVGPLTAALLHETSAFFVLLARSRLLRYDA